MKAILSLLLCLTCLVATGQVRSFYQTCEQQLKLTQFQVQSLQADTARLRKDTTELKELARLQKKRLATQSTLLDDIYQTAIDNAIRPGFLGIGNRKRWRKLSERYKPINKTSL